ncbi:MAG: lysylphosphatidylglycerol synthase transmembrane domain-containing protein [Luteibaculum sp.]
MAKTQAEETPAKQSKKRKRRIAKFVIKLVITGLALFFAFKTIDIQQFKKELLSTNLWWFVLAVLCFNASKIIAAFRIRVFYANAGLLLGKMYNFKLYYLGMFYNLFLPGAIGGDAYKVYALRDPEKGNTKALVWATLADRISGLCLLLILGGLFYLFSNFPIWEEWEISVIVLLASLGCLPAFYIAFRWILDKRVIKNFAQTTHYSLWVQIGQVATALCLLYALSVGDNFMDYLALFMLSSVAAVIPLTVAGVGIREWVFLQGNAFLLIQEEKSVAFAFLFFSAMAISSLFGAIFAFKPIEQDLEDI